MHNAFSLYFTRRNCLLIYGIKPEARENTDEIAKDFFKSKLEITISDGEIDRSHRIGNPNGPIIVKLVRHNLKSLIYSRKKMLKGQNMSITESLTKKRMQCIQKMKILRHEAVITSYWTVDGKVFYSLPNDPKKNILHHYNQMILLKIKMLFTIVQVSSDTWMDCFFFFY